MDFDGSYLWVFVNSGFYVGNPLAMLSLMFLFFARFMPIIALSPFFGAKVLPHPVKVTFALSIFVIFLPQLLNVTTTQIGFDFRVLLLLAKELFIGTVLGF